MTASHAARATDVVKRTSMDLATPVLDSVTQRSQELLDCGHDVVVAQRRAQKRARRRARKQLKAGRAHVSDALATATNAVPVDAIRSNRKLWIVGGAGLVVGLAVVVAKKRSADTPEAAPIPRPVAPLNEVQAQQRTT